MLLQSDKWQSLLHSGACITKRAALLQSEANITNLGKSYHKAGVGNLLQSGSIIIVNGGRYY